MRQNSDASSYILGLMEEYYIVPFEKTYAVLLDSLAWCFRC